MAFFLIYWLLHRMHLSLQLLGGGFIWRLQTQPSMFSSGVHLNNHCCGSQSLLPSLLVFLKTILKYHSKREQAEIFLVYLLYCQ